MTDDEMRFWSKVRIGDGCWTWTASLGQHGYGQVKHEGGPRRANRAEAGERRAAIAEEFGVNKSTVNNIVSGAAWRHI